MDWFRPNSETVAFVAETCLATVILVYLLSLKQKNRLSYLYTGFIFVFFVYSFADIFFTASIKPSFFLKFCNGASVSILEFYWVFFAYCFPRNYNKKESVIVLLLLSIQTLKIWFSADPSTYSLSDLIIYCSLAYYMAWIFIRKIKLSKKGLSADNILLLQQYDKEKNIYSAFAFATALNAVSYTALFLVAFNIISLFIWTMLLHTITLASFTITAYAFLNYTHQETSFRAKLTGVILCVVLIALGILPLFLFGQQGFNQNGYLGVSPEKVSPFQSFLNDFMLIIPFVTIVIVMLFPALFKYVILKPLNKIMSGMQQVNNGNLDADITIEVNDEIGVMSADFNLMTQSLRQYANKMNDLVNERTNELYESLIELKATQSQLIQSEKMASLGELTAGIAHEIQNPLNFVNNFSEVSAELVDEMEEELKKGDVKEASAIASDIKQNLEKIRHHGKRADGIVKGMLQHSRNNSGERELTDLNVLTDEFMQLSYHGLRAKDKTFNATLTTHFDENLPKANVVPQDIGRVLLNLFNNAFYAVQQKQKTAGEGYKPEVTVDTSFTDTFFVIKVKDNGTGIPEAVKDKIMQPFFTTKPTGEGTGLGLSLSYDIVVKGHGGQLNIESEEGKGSAFLINLPVIL